MDGSPEQGRRATTVTRNSLDPTFVCPWHCHHVAGEGGIELHGAGFVKYRSYVHEFPTGKTTESCPSFIRIRVAFSSFRARSLKNCAEDRNAAFHRRLDDRCSTGILLPFNADTVARVSIFILILSIRMVRYIKNLEEFQALLEISNTKLVVVDFTASW